jgi:hypothetical protein
MNDIKKIQEFFSKSLEEDFGQALFNRLKPKDSDLEAIVNTLKQDPKIANSPDQASFKEALERYIRFNSDRNSIGQAAVRTLNYLNTGDRYGNGFTRIFDMLVDKNNLSEAKKETGIDMAKKQLNALGVKYEMSKTDKVRPFKVIYKPINKSDEFYDEFEDIVDLFNLKGVVKSSMNEAKSEDKVDTITMDIPLFLRMLEYAREDAEQDLDLHDVTEKANKLGKERGILQTDDYEEIVGATEDAPLDEATDYMKRRKAQDDYAVSKKDKPSKSTNPKYSGKTDYMKRREKEIEENVAPNHDGKAAPFGSGYKPLEEKIAKALESINEELCPAGKAYIKRRKAAGEKSSAYLSGRAVKVCKGQMSGKSKKK